MKNLALIKNIFIGLNIVFGCIIMTIAILIFSNILIPLKVFTSVAVGIIAFDILSFVVFHIVRSCIL